MTSVADIQKNLIKIQGRLKKEQQVILSTLSPLMTASNRLMEVWRGSRSQDLWRAHIQALEAGEDVSRALQQIHFADLHISEYISDCL